MTTKGIAEFLGKPESTVRRWANKASLKMPSASLKLIEAQKSGGKPAEWDEDETCQIIEIGLGKNAADLYRMNAKQSYRMSELPRINVQGDSEPLGLQGIMEIMAKAYSSLTEVVRSQESRIQRIESRVEERQALLPAPQIKPRDRVAMIVREYAVKSGNGYPEVYRELYREFGYRTNTNPTQCAKNRGTSVIDYIDSEGQIEILEAVAMDLWGNK